MASCLTLRLSQSDHLAVIESDREIFAFGAKDTGTIIEYVKGIRVTNGYSRHCSEVCSRGATERWKLQMLQKRHLCGILIRKDTGLEGDKALIDKRDQLFSVIYRIAGKCF